MIEETTIDALLSIPIAILVCHGRFFEFWGFRRRTLIAYESVSLLCPGIAPRLWTECYFTFAHFCVKVRASAVFVSVNKFMIDVGGVKA